MVAWEALLGGIFDFQPADFMGELNAIGHDESGAGARNMEVVAEEDAIDEVDDAGNIEAAKEDPCNLLKSFSLRLGIDSGSEEGEEEDVGDPVGHAMVGECPKDLP